VLIKIQVMNYKTSLRPGLAQRYLSAGISGDYLVSKFGTQVYNSIV
jgi:hypothetical protein